MNIATISAEINSEDIPFFETLLKKFKAKKVIIREKKDPTQMTKEEFLDKINKASAEKGREVTFSELKSKILSV
ncbi:MAG: hypothetical protein Q4C75_00530 [Bergeyella zoohelcum]|nr:hypothetical protein [Bergeyella zoohelcum]